MKEPHRRPKAERIDHYFRRAEHELNLAAIAQLQGRPVAAGEHRKNAASFADQAKMLSGQYPKMPLSEGT